MTPRRGLVIGSAGGTVTVQPGEVVAVVGTGVGAAVRAATGAGAGRVLLDGRRLRGGPAGHVRAGVGIVHDVPVAQRQPVRDHLLPRAGRDGADRLLADAPLLAGRGGDPAGVLSGGERTVLAWLRCLATDPVAAVLVRPTAGLDDGTLAWTAGVVAAWAGRGVPVLLVPDRPESAAWADRTIDLT